MKKRIGFIILILCLLTFSYQTKEAYAKAELEVDAEIGINNKIKQEKGVPLKVTITNNGDDFSGDFVIDAEVSYSIGSALVYPLDIAAGETKTFNIFLEGYSDNLMYSNTNTRQDYFHFYEGGIEQGKKIKYKGDHYLTPSVLEYDAKFIYAITNNEDRLAGIKKISQFATMPVQTYFINQTEGMVLPEDANELEMIDVIAFDEVSISDLTEEQQQALYSWVQQGGTVVFGANDLGDRATGIFAKQLPLIFNGETEVIAKGSLEKLTGNGVFTEDISVRQASLKQGSAIVSSVDNKILAASTSIGQGKLIQTAFSLGDEPLASMAGYSKLLTNILSLHTNNTNYVYKPSYGFGENWAYSNELFPSFKFSTGWVIALIIIYIIIIGPILYIVLKRRDKREKMWLYIPVISVLVSIAFFGFGAKDRILKPQIQQMALFEVQNDGTLIGTYTNALLTNKSGDFIFQTDNNTSAIASNGYNPLSNSRELHNSSYIKKTAEGSELTLNDVDYWSVQSIVGKTTITDGGKLDIQLEVKQGKLTGTVKNSLPVNLKDVTVLTGTKKIVLGDLDIGDTLNVSEEVTNQTLPAAIQSYGGNYYNPTINQDLFQSKLEAIQATAIDSTITSKQPIITAWSDSSLVPVEFKGNADMSTLSYFVQPFTPKIFLDGEVKFTKDDFNAEVEPVDSNNYSHLDYDNPNNVYISEGEHKLLYRIASNMKLNEFTWNELVTTYDSNVMTLEILNQKTSQYEAIGDSPHAITSNISDYILEDEGIIFKATKVGIDNGESVKLPTFILKGVAK
ncbi:hypothetical protein [Lysinibacillus sp. 54212]|uniref:hypothetical protein n=1 Tax=Lysinibacillus sp. 54212 TaxID=3119829 RepID=UPI002FCC8505